MAEERAIKKAETKDVMRTEKAPLAGGVKEAARPEAVKSEAPAKEAAKAAEAPGAEAKAKPKEADPGKEFVDGIMAEMNLKGASKKRLIRMLAERYNMDRQKVLFRLRRALITERYAAAGH